jgi:O-acetyl-ADP-ribose deacetylase (regulator of RNase III)
LYPRLFILQPLPPLGEAKREKSIYPIRGSVMKQISYLFGDATSPQIKGPKIIAHVCNDVGVWNQGFRMSISDRWSNSVSDYRNWFKERQTNDFGLGAVQFVNVANELWIANMVCQHGIRTTEKGAPVRYELNYEAVETCLSKVASIALDLGATYHMPRIGAGYAGGTWKEIEPIILRQLSSKNIFVFVYHLKEISYVFADTTDPQIGGPKIIAHDCNDAGIWDKGFMTAISARWSEPESQYKKWYAERQTNDFGLGSVQFVKVRNDLWIANMVCQGGLCIEALGPPIRYPALEACLVKICVKALDLKATVHMPRIGVGYAGGAWEKIEPIILRQLGTKKIDVFIYN